RVWPRHCRWRSCASASGSCWCPERRRRRGPEPVAVQVRVVREHVAAPLAWVLVVALAATVMCLPWPVSAADGASPARQLFDIPAQPLDRALLEFSRQSGRQLVAVGSFGDDRRSRPLRGRMEERVALERLLAGTGLAFQLRDDG